MGLIEMVTALAASSRAVATRERVLLVLVVLVLAASAGTFAYVHRQERRRVGELRKDVKRMEAMFCSKDDRPERNNPVDGELWKWNTYSVVGSRACLTYVGDVESL
jgi:hypothetical protein